MSHDGFDGTESDGHAPFAKIDSVEYLLFDSLVHHMLEKCLLTKKDALSVVQAVALVVRGYDDEEHATESRTILSKLKRTYASFEAIPVRSGVGALDGENVYQLRPPLHGGRPEFPLHD